MRHGMKYETTSRRLLRTLTFSTVVALGTLFVASPAWASEIKFGEGPSSLEVDDQGKLTEAGKKTAVKELDKIPGEDAWDLRVWAKLDKGAPGPLYVEFWQTVEVMGKTQNAIVHRHEDSEYDGSKYVNYNILLEGKVGFNKDRTYDVYFVQVGSKGKDIRLASTKLKLINTGREPPEDEESDEEEEDELAEQDELDGLAGDDEETEEPADAAPPETEASKKGCSVRPGDAGGFDGALLLLLAGVALRRRRG
jgi:MYXO-CTERM domain-containing protein